MWEYTEKVMEHYKNPKNVGEIENASAIGEAGSLVCGDALKLYLKIDDNGIITDAKFQTFGCGSAVASSSILTEMLKGKTIEDAEKITNQDIADALGGLPPEKMHCSVMGHEALESAIANYKGIEVSSHCEEKIICSCYHITEKSLREAIENNNLTDLEDVMNYTKAGGACGQCHNAIQNFIDEIRNKKEKIDIKNMSMTQLVLKINNVIEKHIASELRKDGGDIELVDVKDNKIFVSLKGMCKSCKFSSNTLKNFVEASLKEHISPDIEVVEV
jgi:NifU-like protein